MQVFCQGRKVADYLFSVLKANQVIYGMQSYTGAHDVANAKGAACVPNDRGQAAAFGPAPVAIHDACNVLRWWRSESAIRLDEIHCIGPRVSSVVFSYLTSCVPLRKAKHVA